MPLGSPLAHPLGGGLSPVEAAYRALRSSMGVGGSADGGPRATLMESWRWARARGLAATDDDERAALQVSPLLATDLIAAYEQLTGAYSALGASDQERREATAAAWTKFVVAAQPTLLAELRAIDPSADILVKPREQLREVQHGRAHEDWDPSRPGASGPAFGLVAADTRASGYPNFSDDFVLTVHLPMNAGQLTVPAARAVQLARELLDEALPAWMEFAVVGRRIGFVLDVDLLDLTAFGT